MSHNLFRNKEAERKNFLDQERRRFEHNLKEIGSISQRLRNFVTDAPVGLTYYPSLDDDERARAHLSKKDIRALKRFYLADKVIAYEGLPEEELIEHLERFVKRRKTDTDKQKWETNPK